MFEPPIENVDSNVIPKGSKSRPEENNRLGFHETRELARSLARVSGYGGTDCEVWRAGVRILERKGEAKLRRRGHAMALSNFLLTVAAVGAGFVLLKGDVRRSAVNLRRNLKHVKNWLEHEQASASKSEHVKPKEVEAGKSEKVAMKEEKH